MEIVHIITRLIRGGAQKIALSLATHQKKQGHTVHLLFGPESGDQGSFRNEAKRAGLRIRELSFLRRDEHPVQDPLALYEVWSELRSIQPDLVHTHTSKAGLLGRLAGYCSPADVVIHNPHGCIFATEGSIPGVSDRPVLKSVFYWLERFAEPLADAIVTVSRAERDEFFRHGFGNRNNFRVIPNGISPPAASELDTNEQNSNMEYEHLSNRFVVGSIGRLSLEKGQDLLIRAFETEFNRDPFHLLFAGEGEKAEEYRKLVAKYDLEDRVTFLGLQQDLTPFWSTIDCYVQPSRYEGFGLAALEALFQGTPVVAARVGGLRELIDDAETGFLFGKENVDELVERITQIYKNPDVAKKIGQQAQEMVHNVYTLDRMGNDYQQLYRDYVSEDTPDHC